MVKLNPKFVGLLLVMGIILQPTLALTSVDVNSNFTSPPEAFVSLASKSPVEVKVTESAHRVDISVSLPDVQCVDNGLFTYWRIPNEGVSGREGYPDLPAVSRWVRVPSQGQLRMDFRIDDEMRIPGSPPAAYSDPAEEQVGSSSIAHVDEIYPPQPVVMSEPMIMRGIRVVKLDFYPIRWDPIREEYIRSRRIETQIASVGGVGINEVRQLTRRPSRGFDRMVDALLVNPPHRDQDEEYLPGGYLVVADERLQETVDEFVLWKRRAGHPVSLITYEHPGDVGQVEIRNAIREHYEETGFELLVLMGNDDADEPMLMPYDDDFYDIYYAQLEGDDMFPDVAVGTFNCLEQDNLTCAIRRAVSYQSAPYSEETDWFTRAGVGVGACSVPDDLSPSYTGKWITEVLERQGFDDLVTSFYADNEVDDPSPMVVNLYNRNVNFILVRAHQWQVDEEEIRPGPVYPFHFLVSSGTISPPNQGAFNRIYRVGTADELRGPSAGFGHFSSPRTNCANALAGGLIESMFLFDIGSYGWARNYTVGNLARVMVEDGVQLMPYYYSHWRYYGDPGQWCWIGVPRLLNVDYDENFDIDQTYYQVGVTDAENDEPVAAALVCLFQQDGFQQRLFTDEEGRAYFSWDHGDLVESDLVVTVTGKDLMPHLGTSELVEQGQLMTAENVQVNDDIEGDGDGVPNPGEVLVLSMDLVNRGSEAIAPDLMMISIQPLSPWVEAVGEAQWDEVIEPGAAIPIEDNFTIHVLDGCPNDEQLRFRVNITWDRTIIHTGFWLSVQSADMEFVRVEGELAPGQQSDLRATITNRGRKDTGPLQARLESFSPFIAVTVAGGRFPAVNIGENVDQADDPFIVVSDGITIPGSLAKFRMILEGDPGVVDTVYFSLPVGQAVQGDPLGPDEYGYIALDNTDDDVEWAQAPEYDWIEICPWLPENDFEGEILPIAMGEEDDTSILLNLPFPLRYYGEEFDQITVCSNGWIAVGDQTNLLNQQNWLLPGFDGAYGMMAVFWDRLHWDMRSDGLLRFYDVGNGRYIIEWVTAVYDNQNRMENVFQVILFDPDRYETPTGDSRILFQYNIVNNGQDRGEANAHASVGISSPDGLDGLTYTYWNEYPVSCAPLGAGRAILWTTIAYAPPTVVTGQVTRWVDSTGVAGAQVVTSNGYETITRRDGHYRITGVEPGIFDMTVSAVMYGDVMVEGIELEEAAEIEQDFVLPHGWLVVDPDSIVVLWSGEVSDHMLSFGSVGELGVLLWAETIAVDSGFNFNLELDTTVVPSGFEANYLLSIDASGLQPGEYHATVGFYTDTPQIMIPMEILVTVTSSAREDDPLPVAYSLADPYPNPFNARMTVEFALPRSAQVKLSLVDLHGRVVAIIAEGFIQTGSHLAAIDIVDLPAGLYFLCMETQDFKAAKRVVLLK